MADAAAVLVLEIEETIRRRYDLGERSFHLAQFVGLAGEAELVVALQTLEERGKIRIDAEARCRPRAHRVKEAPLLDLVSELRRGLQCPECHSDAIDVFLFARVTDLWDETIRASQARPRLGYGT